MIRIFQGQALHPDREGRFPEQDDVVRGVRYGVIDMVAIHNYYGLLSQLPENSVSLNALKPFAYLYPNAPQLSTPSLEKVTLYMRACVAVRCSAKTVGNLAHQMTNNEHR